MVPHGWPGASSAPYYNIVGQEMRLRNPENGDYRVLEDHPAEEYGCQTFTLDPAPAVEPVASIHSDLPMRDGTIIAGGLLPGHTVWDASLVRVVDTVEIPADGSLTLAPGVRVEFAGFHRILVRGRLWAEGNSVWPIRFQASSDNMAQEWDGIDFLNPPAGGPGSLLSHCILQNGVARESGAGASGPVVGGTQRPQAGGALSVVGCNNLTVTSCTFKNNRADYGGAVYVGYGSSPVFAGNLFTENHAVWNGSAMYSVYAFPKLVHNTIAGNVCEHESEFHLCAAVENFNGKLDLSGNIIRENHTPHYSGLQVHNGKEYYTRYSNIEAFVGGIGNIDEDPSFLGHGLHPYQLESGSVCLDGGKRNTWTHLLAELDPRGSDRWLDGDLDMGCYEFNPASPVGTQSSFVLHQNSPNPAPAGRGTRIAFELPVGSPIQVDVFDLRGHRVRRLLDGNLPAGGHAVIWDGADASGRRCAAGVYRYRLRAGSVVQTRPMVLLP